MLKLKFTQSAIIFSVVFASAGCASMPPLPSLEGGGTRYLAAAPGGFDKPVTDLSRWWEGFNDPFLTYYVALALQQNLDLEQATARIDQARAQLAGANSALLPRGDVNGQAATLRQSNETAIGQIARTFPGYDRDIESYEANLAVGWELDLFGSQRRRRDAARAEYTAARASAAATHLAISAQVAETYVNIRGLQTRLGITRKQVDIQRRLLEIVRLQNSKGVAADLQVSQAETALAQVEALLPEQSAALEQAMNALDVLLASTPGTHRAELDTDTPIPAAPGLANVGAPGDLLRRRPDLVVAEQKLMASRARIGVAVAEYYPKVSLTGLLGTAAIDSGNLFTGSAAQGQGVLGLRWRLFDFGRVDAEVDASKGAYAEALASYRLSVLRATEDVENALSAMNHASQRAALLERGEDASARASKASLAAYEGGATSLIEVLDADTRLLNMRDAFAQARASKALAAIASFKALGGGWNRIDLEDGRGATTGNQ
ncbi:efflux transporter outer membrane subunit [Xanthomonas euvesicatoria]|uniref:efflux transporter outer membrane subunit n=1 Tax=Xanthomonas euvesicatoria TaxID=456327 RepID=UPI0030C827AB